MSLLATREDFEPVDHVEGASALYYQPHDHSGYDHSGYDHTSPTFGVRADALVALYGAHNQPTAIWGCGWGALVDHLTLAGLDAHGFDASAYALQRSNEELPAIAGRVFLRDALAAHDVDASRKDAGLKGNQRFAVVVTEDLLTCMDDREIAVTLPLLRQTCQSDLLHIVTPVDPWSMEQGLSDPRINWKTQDDWRALVAPDLAYDAVANAVL